MVAATKDAAGECRHWLAGSDTGLRIPYIAHTHTHAHPKPPPCGMYGRVTVHVYV